MNDALAGQQRIEVGFVECLNVGIHEPNVPPATVVVFRGAVNEDGRRRRMVPHAGHQDIAGPPVDIGRIAPFGLSRRTRQNQRAYAIIHQPLQAVRIHFVEVAGVEEGGLADRFQTAAAHGGMIVRTAHGPHHDAAHQRHPNQQDERASFHLDHHGPFNPPGPHRCERRRFRPAPEPPSGTSAAR